MDPAVVGQLDQEHAAVDAAHAGGSLGEEVIHAAPLKAVKLHPPFGAGRKELGQLIGADGLGGERERVPAQHAREHGGSKGCFHGSKMRLTSHESRCIYKKNKDLQLHSPSFKMDRQRRLFESFAGRQHAGC